MKKVVVAVSGGGRSLKNLLFRQKNFGSFKVCGVISSKAECGGAELARSSNLPLLVESFSSHDVASDALSRWLHEIQPDLIVLAGFLKIFPVTFPGKDTGWMTINIHPSLLPAHGGKGFYGMRVHRAVLASGDQESGASIHQVSGRYDEGDLIAQVRVPVLKSDTPESLAGRVFDAECFLLPVTIHRLVTGHRPEQGVWQYEAGSERPEIIVRSPAIAEESPRG